MRVGQHGFRSRRTASCPRHGKPLGGTHDTMYTQIVKEIPISEGIFGQGAGATFDDIVVTINDRS